MIALLVVLVLLGAVAYLVDQYVPMPAPFRVVVRVVVVLILLWYLLQAIGLVAPPGRLP